MYMCRCHYMCCICTADYKYVPTKDGSFRFCRVPRGHVCARRRERSFSVITAVFRNRQTVSLHPT